MGGRDGDDPSGIIVGADGTVFVAGSTNSFGAGNTDAFLLQLAPGGKTIDARTWGGPSIDRGDAIDLDPDGNLAIGATAEEPPYSFLKASTHTSKDRAVLGTPDFPLVSVESGGTPAGGTVEAIAGTTTDDPGFDAALLVVAP